MKKKKNSHKKNPYDSNPLDTLDRKNKSLVLKNCQKILDFFLSWRKKRNRKFYFFFGILWKNSRFVIHFSGFDKTDIDVFSTWGIKPDSDESNKQRPAKLLLEPEIPRVPIHWPSIVCWFQSRLFSSSKEVFSSRETWIKKCKDFFEWNWSNSE